MRYIANPVEVEAFKIDQIGTSGEDGSLRVNLSNGNWVTATPGIQRGCQGRAWFAPTY